MNYFVKLENNCLAAPDIESLKVDYCCVCSEVICEGDSYWDTVAGAVCCVCAESMTVATFLHDICCEKENIAIKD